MYHTHRNHLGRFWETDPCIRVRGYEPTADKPSWFHSHIVFQVSEENEELVFIWVKERFLYCVIFFNRYALVHPKEKRIVIVESLLCPSQIRDTLASVLFDHFEVSSFWNLIIRYSCYQTEFLKLVKVGPLYWPVPNFD